MSPIEQQWINELSCRINDSIDTHITVQDFINFFKKRKEKTASSYSGRHMGHYKAIAKLAIAGQPEIAQTLVNIINISILTSQPLHRWQKSMQVMLEKGKGLYIEHLQIIQLCEADLNFALNIIWGIRLIQMAMKDNIMDESQYALPGMTCNSAVWNKVLYLDLMHQTMATGIMTDYDATAAFDRVLHSMSVITCRRLGLPMHACMFMYKLLQNMEFHLVTGFGVS
jgi:hypothetical protein